MNKKSLFFIITLLCFFLSLAAQTGKVPRFSKSLIGDNGCYAYMPTSETVVFELDYSEDSSKVYTGGVKAADSLNYEVILVELKSETATEDQEDLLISYLDYLKTAFNVTKSAGYGKGHTSEKNPAAKGIIDFWEDEDGIKYDIKGWIDNKRIAVMIIYGATEVNYNVGQLFKNGIFLNE